MAPHDCRRLLLAQRYALLPTTILPPRTDRTAAPAAAPAASAEATAPGLAPRDELRRPFPS